MRVEERERERPTSWVQYTHLNVVHGHKQDHASTSVSCTNVSAARCDWLGR